MAIRRINLRRFDKGLWLVASPDEMPRGSLRRARGVYAIKTQSIKSRFGTSLVQSVNATSITRYGDTYFYGVGSELYKGGTSIKSSLSGGTLHFTSMPPAAGIEDYLFVTGGGELFKVDSSGSVTNWGIDEPSDGMTAAVGSALTKTIDDFEGTPSTRWTGTNATIADESSIVMEGSASMKVTIDANKIGKATYAYFTATGSEVDMSTASDGTEVAGADYLRFWVRYDEPANIDWISMEFSLGNEDFTGEVYRCSFVFEEGIPFEPGSADALDWIENYVGGSAKRKKAYQTVLRSLQQNKLQNIADTWQDVYVAIDEIVYEGAGSYNWSDVQAIRIQVRTNKGGSANVWFDDLYLYGGYGLQGRYRYKVTFKNSTTGNRSNANDTEVEIDDVLRSPIVLSNIPTSSDSQVAAREIWRTVGSGEVYFLCTTINDNTTTTFTDTVADYPYLDNRDDAEYLQATELPTDNAKPYSHFTDAIYHNSTCFWISGQAGYKGRVYYSPLERVEAMSEYINVTNDDDPCQRLFVWSRAPYVITESGIYSIVGTHPYTAHRVFGCPGTTKPETVALTPYGVAYESPDGPRLFNGTSAPLISAEAIEAVFRGDSVGDIAAFDGVAAACREDEYFITDGSQPLAVNLRDGTWRDIGLGCTALYYARDANQLLATVSSNVYEIEKEGTYTDGGSAIPFIIEPYHVRLHEEHDLLVQRIHVDINTNSQTISVTLILDNDTIDLGSFSTTNRERKTIHIGKLGRVVGVKLTGSLTAQIEVFGIDIDVYIPDEQVAA